MLSVRTLADRAAARAALAALALVLAVAVATAPAVAEPLGRARVIDGATLEVGGVRYRLFGVSAPGETETCTVQGRTWACGRHSAFALADFIGKTWVRCIAHGTGAPARALCYRDKTDIGAWMVRAGWARVDAKDAPPEYPGYEALARRERRGLWGSGESFP